MGVGGGSAPRPGRFIPGKYPVPNVQEAGWAPGLFWTDTENLAPSPTGIRSPDRPARSESLYRLSYPGLFGNKMYLLSLNLMGLSAVRTAQGRPRITRSSKTPNLLLDTL